MNFDKAFKEMDLTNFFLNATKASVASRFRGESYSDREDAVQDVRATTLQTLARRIERLVEAGATEEDAAQTVLTKEFISSVVARLAKRQARKYRERRAFEEYDESVSGAAKEQDVDLQLSLREAIAQTAPSLRRLWLATADGYSGAELAKRLGASEREVRRRFGRLREYLTLKGVGL